MMKEKTNTTATATEEKKNQQSAPATAEKKAQSKASKAKADSTKKDSKTASKTTKKGTAPAASIAEDGRHFELIIPAIKKGEKVGDWSITTSEKKPLAIPTKTEDNNTQLTDTQRVLLDEMKTSITGKIGKLNKAKTEKPEDWTDNKQLELDQQTALLKAVDIQRKKYIATKYNPVATISACVMLGTAPAIEVKSLVTTIRTSWEDLLNVAENLYSGKEVKLTADQQSRITDIKKVIMGIATPYCAEVKNGEKVIVKQFPLSLGNKDIFKLLIGVYDFYRKDGKGDMTDGLKLDGKEEKALKKIIINLIYAKMTGAK